MWLQQSTTCRRYRSAQASVERQGPGRLNLDSRAERCWVDHTRDSPTGLEAGQVFALGANSDAN
jgi:hypothetical protein